MTCCDWFFVTHYFWLFVTCCDWFFVTLFLVFAMYCNCLFPVAAIDFYDILSFFLSVDGTLLYAVTSYLYNVSSSIMFG